MKKSIYLSIVTLVLVSAPLFSHAFSSLEEVDQYYDAQKQQLETEANLKIQEINTRTNQEILKIRARTEAEKIQAYKDAFGDQFETVRPFLTVSNPDPEQIAHTYLPATLPRDMATNFLKFIDAVNPDLAIKASAIYEKERSALVQIQKPTALKKPSPESVFDLISRMNLSEAKTTMINLEKNDPEMYIAVSKLAEKKSQKENSYTKNITSFSTSSEQSATTTSVNEYKTTDKTVIEHKSLAQKIVGFFSRLAFWR